MSATMLNFIIMHFIKSLQLECTIVILNFQVRMLEETKVS